MERRALLVGINHYERMPDLNWCINDALAIRQMLAIHENNEPNFSCHTLLGNEPAPDDQAFSQQPVTFITLNRELEKLFDYDGMVLFYFSGHGYQTEQGVYLATQDGNSFVPGILLKDLLAMANASPAREVVLIIDSCYSGALGEPDPDREMENFYLKPGVTLLASSLSNQPSLEQGGCGLFTNLVVAALKGGASDVRGHISAASVYGYVEQALGPWDQRPIYKSNARHLSAIRNVAPDITDDELRQIVKYFPTPDYHFSLDPTYELTRPEAILAHVNIFQLFKHYQVARLLRPTFDNDLYFTALRKHPVELTRLGQFYWQLVQSDLLGSAPASQGPRRKPMPEPESLAKFFHETYENLAPSFSYETRKETNVPWADVPANNKQLMIAVATKVLLMLFPPEEPAPLNKTTPES